MDTIKKAAIAGILIQLSRFIVAALIDVSTITTYAVWGMPMSILKTDENIKNTKILQPDVSINLNNKKKLLAKDFIVSYQVTTQAGTPIYLSPCITKEDNTKQTYIVGRLYGDEKFRNQGKLDSKLDKNINACVYQKDVVFFYEFPDIANLTGQNYTNKLDLLLSDAERKGREACNFIINPNRTEPTTVKCEKNSFNLVEGKAWEDNPLRYDNLPTAWLTIDANAGKSRFENSAATSIGQIIDKSKWFVGPLATIYSSLMDFANLSDTSNGNWTMWKWIAELVIRVWVAAGLLFPLIALTVVLLIRIWFLRCIIATSPLIILIKVFDLWGKMWSIAKQIDITNIIKAIFAPVVTVFALSIWLIFMTALMSTYKNSSPDQPNNMLQGLGVTQKIWAAGENDSINIFGTTLRYPKSLNTYAGAKGDWFSWMIICFAGIWVMWFILFAAIAATGTVGEIGKKIKDFWENAISTAPIISRPWMGKLGIGTALDNFSPTGNKSRNHLTNAFNNSDFINLDGQQKEINNAMEKLSGKTKEGDKLITMINGENPNYTEFRETITNQKDTEIKEWDLIKAIEGNQNIEKFLKEMEDWDKKNKILVGLKIKDQRNNKISLENFTKKLGTSNNKAELDKILQTDEAKSLAKINQAYKEQINIENKTYTIAVNKTTNVLEATEDPATK